MRPAVSDDVQIHIKTGSNEFICLAGLKTKYLRLSANIVDVTHLESENQWRELLPGAGLKSASLEGQGVFVSGEAAALARLVFFEQTVNAYQFILPQFGCVEGPFLMSALTYCGLSEGLAQYELTLMSAGAPTFTPL